ncbi:MerR family transcriptional regulator [Paenibacillus xanthanilyticus]|uniref:MerR family transcriptional regulator n=1 Tax=Paenibacillus xanthanilyticus TaxID=1783531 RepID=A0ABV8K3S0_9BACL
MYKISAFSKLAGVSVKTLRFYDDIGLLAPAAIDEHNGYRYYAEEQLLTVKRIQAFKSEGFTLEAIRSFLEADGPSSEVQTALAAKKNELERLVAEASRQANEIGQRLERARQTAEARPEFGFRAVEPMLAASIRDRVPRSQLCLLLNELTAYAEAHGQTAERLVVTWHDETDDGQCDLEVALPLDKSIPGSDRVQVGLLPGYAVAASHVHVCNPYQGSCHAPNRLSAWLASQGLQPASRFPVREVYLTPDRDMYGAARLAELLIPLEAKI